MGVDYNGVGGIGIEVTKEIIGKLIAGGLFTEEDWDNDWCSCLDKLGIPYDEAGDSSYSGDTPRIYLWVKGKNLGEIISNQSEFKNILGKYGIIVGTNELLVISDLLVW